MQWQRPPPSWPFPSHAHDAARVVAPHFSLLPLRTRPFLPRRSSASCWLQASHRLRPPGYGAIPQSWRWLRTAQNCVIHKDTHDACRETLSVASCCWEHSQRKARRRACHPTQRNGSAHGPAPVSVGELAATARCPMLGASPLPVIRFPARLCRARHPGPLAGAPLQYSRGYCTGTRPGRRCTAMPYGGASKGRRGGPGETQARRGDSPERETRREIQPSSSEREIY